MRLRGLMGARTVMADWRRWLVLALITGSISQASAAPVSPPTLSYFQRDGLSYRWMLWQPGQAQAIVFLRTRNQPKNVFWARDATRVYYTLEGKLFRARLDRVPGQSEQLASLPDNVGEIRGLWQEQNTRRLRIVAMQAIAPADVLARGGLRYRLPDGRTVAGANVPAWGAPFVCTVLELGGDGATWQVVTWRGTKDLAGDTPGISVVDDLRHEWGASNDSLLASYTCGAGQCRTEVPENLIRLAQTQTVDKLNAEDMSMLSASSPHTAVLFETSSGDQLHMVPPVLVIAAAGVARLVLPGHERKQLGLAIEQSHLLVADELTGSRPIVVDLRTGKVQFHADGWEAVWRPR